MDILKLFWNLLRLISILGLIYYISYLGNHVINLYYNELYFIKNKIYYYKEYLLFN